MRPWQIPHYIKLYVRNAISAGRGTRYTGTRRTQHEKHELCNINRLIDPGACLIHRALCVSLGVDISTTTAVALLLSDPSSRSTRRHRCCLLCWCSVQLRASGGCGGGKQVASVAGAVLQQETAWRTVSTLCCPPSVSSRIARQWVLNRLARAPPMCACRRG